MYPLTTSASCFSGGRRVTCKTPMLNGRNFEKLTVNEIKEKVFAESNIRDMVKLLDEEIKELVGEQGERLQNTKEELGDMKSSWPASGTRISKYAAPGCLDPRAETQERLCEAAEYFRPMN